VNQQSSHPTDRQIESNHLTDLQIKEYVSGSVLLEQQLSHMEGCDQCSKRLLEEETKQLRLDAPQVTPSRRGPCCPEEEVLRDYAAGLCASGVASDVIHHAAHCDYCAPRLKNFLELFSDDFSAEDQEFLGRLPAPTNLRKLGIKPKAEGFFARVRRLFSRFHDIGLTWGKASALATAGAGLAAIVVAASVVPGWIAGMRVNAAEQLLTKAASAENPSTGLKYAWSPQMFDMKLGGDNSHAASSDHALHKVQSLADEHENSRDPRWLRIQVRVALLEKDYGSAIKDLNNARDKGLLDAATEIDLAAAYLQRGTAPGAKDEKINPTQLQDVFESIDLLGKVLKEPNLTANERSAALYDLAVAHEATGQWDLAIEFWNQYLALDASGPWAEEADRHRADDEKKKSTILYRKDTRAPSSLKSIHPTP